MNWYDAAYGEDPEAGNVFGREDRAERRNAALHAYLSQGGRLADYARLSAQVRARERLRQSIARALAPGHRLQS